MHSPQYCEIRMALLRLCPTLCRFLRPCGVSATVGGFARLDIRDGPVLRTSIRTPRSSGYARRVMVSQCLPTKKRE